MEENKRKHIHAFYPPENRNPPPAGGQLARCACVCVAACLVGEESTWLGYKVGFHFFVCLKRVSPTIQKRRTIVGIRNPSFMKRPPVFGGQRGGISGWELWVFYHWEEDNVVISNVVIADEECFLDGEGKRERKPGWGKEGGRKRERRAKKGAPTLLPAALPSSSSLLTLPSSGYKYSRGHAAQQQAGLLLDTQARLSFLTPDMHWWTHISSLPKQASLITSSSLQ